LLILHSLPTRRSSDLSAQKFEFYPDGVSKLTVDYIENLDKERMEIADLFNIETKDILSLLNEFYGTNHKSLFEALPSLFPDGAGDRKSTRLNSSHVSI